jgi:hypothetical protein
MANGLAKERSEEKRRNLCSLPPASVILDDKKATLWPAPTSIPSL